MDPTDRVPALVVSGFLGSGKTTLVRRLLAAAQAEGKSHNDLIVNILGAKLGRSPKTSKPYLKEL